jgi:hypothetical protein
MINMSFKLAVELMRMALGVLATMENDINKDLVLGKAEGTHPISGTEEVLQEVLPIWPAIEPAMTGAVWASPHM